MIIAFQAAVRFWTYPAADEQPPAASTWITDRNGNTLAAFVGGDGSWLLPLRVDEISPHLLSAIVAVEDQRFYQHGGVDWQSAASALWQDAIALRYRRGASTLTMQLQHLRHPEPRSLPGKLAQAIRADQIEQKLTKQQILVEYLNRAPFGGNLSGCGAASLRYFGRRCADLSLGQAALLAGLPQSPARLRPDRFPQTALLRRNHVLERMQSLGMITESQRKEASAEPVDASWHPLPQDAPDEIGLLPTLIRLQHQSPGQVIHTTIDPHVERQATVATQDQLNRLGASHITAAAVVVLDTASGECLAAISRTIDRPDDAGDLDLTVRPRSSGSTLKPFIYASAFDAGICTPRTVLDDSPVAWAGYEPSNYDRQFAGPLPAAEALSQSRNVPALVLLSKVRVDRAVEVMHGCGLATLAKTPDRYGLSLAIGGAEVTPMELAEAYATLARGGVHKIATLVTASNQTHLTALLRASSCLSTLQCIADPERTRRVCAAAVDLGPAWKTGTSSGHRDAWCAAVTPRRTVVVWLGNADGAGSDALVGADAAAPLALNILSQVDTASGGFAPPAGFLSSIRPAALAEPSSELSMISPINHQKIFTDPSLPANQQRVALRARLAKNSPDDQLFWFVDGQPIGICHSDEIVWWDPIAGTHEVRVVSTSGQAAIASVQVMAPNSPR